MIETSETGEKHAIFRLHRFAGTFVATGAVFLVLYAVGLYFGVDLMNAGVIFIPFYIAGILEGQRYAKLHGVLPQKRLIWKASVMMALIGAVIVMALLVLSAATTGQFDQDALLGSLLIFAFSFCIGVPVCRWFYHLGARRVLKADRRQKLTS